MKNKVIIVFSGKQFSGKDTVAKILLEHFKSFKRIGIADAIKLRYSQKTGLSVEEIEKNKSKYRQDLIELGNWGRAQSPDYWLNEVIKYDGNTIVTDIRMKHELEVFKSYGAYTVRVEADIKSREKRGILTSVNDKTETELDNISDWDFIIQNDEWLKELNKKVEDLIMAIKTKYGELC